MGFNVGTIAIRGKPIQDIHAALGLRATEACEEDPDAPVVAAMLPSGWYQLYFNDRNYPGSAGLRDLSLEAELVFVDVCETAMASLATYWQNGRQGWSIAHDSQHGLDHLEVSGDKPACFESISHRLRTLQREEGDADYIFDIPIEVVAELTGFRYDGNPNGYPVSEFIVLERIRPARKWWRFW